VCVCVCVTDSPAHDTPPQEEISETRCRLAYSSSSYSPLKNTFTAEEGNKKLNYI